MDLSGPGLPVHHQLPEPTQPHVQWVSDAIQQSHPPSSPSPPVFNLSQYQGLFKWVSSSNQVVKALEFQSSSTPQFKSINSSALSFLYIPTLTSIHGHWKNHSIDSSTRQTFVDKVMSLLFNKLSRLVITFLPRSKRLLISWLKSPCAVILEPKKIKSVTASTVSPSISQKVMGPDAMFLVFWMLSFKPTFSLSYFTFIKRLFSSSSLSVIRVLSSAYMRLLIFLPEILIPACASSSLAVLMMYSAYKLNKHGDNMQTWRTPFPIWNHSVVPCPVLTVSSWPAYTFLRRKVRSSGIPISWRIFHSLLWSTQSKALV